MNIEELTSYEILDDRYLDDVKSRALVLRHKKTGARIAVLSNDDENKVFYIGFRTPPEDETGVPHIIEHTTLCGSDKYPVKDPFMELEKGSLNTFLNAMTYPDKTVYPVASCNDKDFQNLVDVYLDAVFHPNITKYEEIFKQEGWHYELDSPEGELKINGVVYSEMKGAYSSPEEVLQTEIMVSLFPDNCYGKNSGGNPEHIPELTYQAYLDFYHKYYHPSNSYIFLYGNMDVAEKLDYIDREYLSLYDFLRVDSQVAEQKPFDAVRNIRKDYSVSADDSQEDATFLSWNRVVGDAKDTLTAMAFDVLDYALISSPGAPLFDALQEAGIGEDDYGMFVSDTRQMTFSVVAKNAQEADLERFDEIIRTTLQEQVEKGINRDTLLAAINSNEFKFREGDYGRFPKGLLISLQCLESWMFDDLHPFARIECLGMYAELKKRLETGYFEELVQKYLLDNTFGSLLVVAPNPGKNEEEEKALAQKLAAYKASLSEAQIQELVDQTHALWKYQQEPSTEEQLRTVPMLGREDIDVTAAPFSNLESKTGGVPVIRHDVETNGISYMTLYFDASDLEPEEIGYLGLMNRVLGYMDTKDHSYTDFSNSVNIETGGILLQTHAYEKADNSDDYRLMQEVNIKVMTQNFRKAEELLTEMLLETDLSDISRLKEIVAQTKAGLQESLSSWGDATARNRAMSSFSRKAYCTELTNGISFARLINQVMQQLLTDPSAVTDRIHSLCEKLFNRRRLTVSITSNAEEYQKITDDLAAFLQKFPEGEAAAAVCGCTMKKEKEAFTDASAIDYVARCGNFRRKGFAYTGTLELLKNILSKDYLWNVVRVKGGAYGVMNGYGRNGDAYFVSYRDPNLEETIQAYEKVVDYILSFDCDEREMTKYVIGTFGSMDLPLTPRAKGMRSMNAYLEGITADQVQKERNEIISASPAEVRALADLVQAVLDEKAFCVVGSETAVRKASALFDSIEKLTV